MPRVAPARLARRPATLLRADVEQPTEEAYAAALGEFNRWLQERGFGCQAALMRAAARAWHLWAAHFLQYAYDFQVFGRAEAGTFVSGLRRQYRQASAVGEVPEDLNRQFAGLWRMLFSWS